MEVYESIAWIAMGFIPIILVLEIAYRVTSKSKIVGRKDVAAAGKTIGGFIER